MTRKKPGKVLIQGVESGMWLFRITVLILLVVFCFSGIRTVKTTNVGILTRFGKIIPSGSRKEVREAGIVLGLPYPIDDLIQIPTKDRMREIVIEDVWKSLKDRFTTNKIDPLLEGYCITGDNNVVQTKVVVKYFISDPKDYHFGLANPEELIRDLVLASLTQTISGWSVDEVLRLQKTYSVTVPVPSAQGNPGETKEITVTEKLVDAVSKRAQQRLDDLHSGMSISGLEFVFMHHPRHVNREFVNVQNATVDAKKASDMAGGEADRVKLMAEAQKKTQITLAETFKDQIVAQAEAEYSEFLPLYQEYRKAPEHVWNRLYMDAMEQVWENAGTKKFVPAHTRIIIPNSEERK